MKLDKVNPNLVLYGVMAVAVIYVVYNGKKAVSAVVDTAKNVVAKDLNPASDQNLAYRGVNKVGEAITGESNWTLGGWIYDITHSTSRADIGRIGSVSEVQYDEMGNVISTSQYAEPSFTGEQMARIGGNTGTVPTVGGAGGDWNGSFNQISKSNPLDPLTWGSLF